MPYEPLSSETVVNTTTDGSQRYPSVTSLSDGGFVVCWYDDSGLGGDGDGSSIKAQIYDSTGSPVGGEFLVNSYTVLGQSDPAVVATSDGGFVISWVNDAGSPGDIGGSSVVARIFDAVGTAAAPEFLVATSTAGQQIQPAMALLENGSFVISWSDASGIGGDDSSYAIKAQLYGPDGSPIGGEFLVNTDIAGLQLQPTVTGLAGGGFAIAWMDQVAGSTFDVRAQIYDADGNPVGGELLVNTNASGGFAEPSIAGLAGGGFVVTWAAAANGDSDIYGVQAQIFASDGTPVGGEFLVNSYIPGEQSQPVATGLPNGSFVISYVDGVGGFDYHIRAQVFGGDGSRIGDEIYVNTLTDGVQIRPTIATLQDGGFVISWMDNFNGNDIHMQIYSGDDSADARDDAFTTDESNGVTGNLFADNGSGADVAPVAIAAVNGDAGAVGNQITLASGALLTVNSDGTFNYDPNGAFQYTPTFGSGAFNTPSADSFSYTLEGGDSATVVITINGVNNDDTIIGNEDGNRLIGGVGNDSIFGLGGADYITGGLGDDIIFGDEGADRAGWYQTNEALGGATVSLLLQGQAQDTGSQGWDTLFDIENLSGTPFADSLTGDDNDNWLWGSPATMSPGNISASNNDFLDGQGGNDLLTVGLGNHTVIGGDGTDTLRFTENGLPEPAITIDLNLQGASQDTGAGSWTLTGIENVSGGREDDTLIGDGVGNTLAGDLGADTIFGGGGNDLLLGDGFINVSADLVSTITYDRGTEGGNDQLNGGGGDDSLYGGGGADTLRGGADNDDLHGGSGDDLLVGGFGDDLVNGGDGFDRAGNYHLNEALGGVTIDLNLQGVAQDTGSQGWDTLTGIEYVSGTPWADTLTGDANDNVLWGSVATIDPDSNWVSSSNNDTLDGGAGNDLLYAGIGNHTLTGGEGNDTVGFTENWGDDPAIHISLALQGGAQDTGVGLWTLTGIENLSGGNDNDQLTGDENANILAGSFGNDLLSGGGGADSLYGDGVIDTAAPSSGPSTLFPDVGANGNDVLDGGDGNDELYGGGGNDQLIGGEGDDLLDGGEGQDLANYGPGSGAVTVDLGAGTATRADGNDTLVDIEDVLGSNENDLLIGDGVYNVLNGGGGDDVIDGAGGDDTLMGGDGNDQLYGNSGNDQLIGGLGDDVLDGGDDRDVADYQYAAGGVTALLYGGGFGEAFGADGYDQLYNIEDLNGSVFNDILYGDEASNMVVGNDGHDDVRGGGGDDNILAGAGDDLLYGNAGNDWLDGGDGYDRVGYYSGATAGVTVDLNLQGVQQDTGQGLDVLVSIENVSGTRFGDTLTGDDGDNVLWGSAATLNGVVSTENNDTLSGGGGNDLLIAGIGNHVIDGGDGIDTFRFTENGVPETGITLSLLLAGEAQASGNGSWTLTGIENLSGGIGNDSLTGDGNANVLAGDLGDDMLSGGAGDDTLYGDGQIMWDDQDTGRSGPATTTADATGEYVGGVSGNDILEGGLGDDVIDGGGGIDTASYANAAGGVQAFLYRLGNGNGESAGADGFDILSNIENLTGSAFNDQLGGNNLDNVLEGGDGHDGLRGNGGNDVLLGGAGDDFLNGSAGDDYIDGGSGSDRAAFYEDATADGVTVDLRIAGAQDTGQGMDTLVGIENVSGSIYGDTLTGDDNDNWLWGSASTLADGTIVTTNNDTLSGGGGNDLLIAGIGNHVIDGGTGTDTFRFNENGAPETGITLSLLLAGAQDSGNGSWTLTNIENLSGSISGDTLIGDGNANVLAGDLGDDTLVGGGGNDTLYGDGQISWDGHGTGGSGPITTYTDATSLYVGGVAGNDTLEGGLGNDLLDGGGGTDTASYEHASGGVQVTLFNNLTGNGTATGADGNDTLVGIENVTGSAFADTITGSAGSNVLAGGAGNDFLQARGGDDTVYGGEGNDYLGGGAGNDLLDGGDGWDRASFSNGSSGPVTVDLRIQGVAQDTGLGFDTLTGIEHVTGTAWGDTLTGDDGANWLWGGTDAAGVTDTIDGQGGDDLIEVGMGNHNLSGGTGTDTFSFNPFTVPTNATISLALQGTAQDTGAGTMTLSGFENLSGSSYADTLIGDGNANVLAGGEAGDTLVGGGGNDTLYGDGFYWSGPDGPSGPITLSSDVGAFGGFSGDDVLEGGEGNDQLFGGGGSDTASYVNALGGVSAGLGVDGSGGAFGATTGSDSFNSIENLTGSAFNDQFGGNADANVLTGNGGHDIMVGRGGNDILLGGDGDDYLRGDDGDAGDDIIDGGSGWDRAVYNLALTGVTVDLNIQGVAQATGQGMDTLISIEHASGSNFDDTIIGNGGDNWLRTWGGNDTISGGDGNDLIETMPGDNIIDGGNGIDSWSFYGDGTFFSSGVSVSLALQGTTQDTLQGMMLATGFENLSGTMHADSLSGDGGDNVIAGDLGNDTLSGGAGNDVLYGDGSIFVDWHGNGGSGPITTFADITLVLGGVGGDDTLEGGLGNDVINGGGGTDTASYANAAGAVTVNLFAGTATGADGNDTLASIENLVGSAYADTLIGNGLANVLEGGNGLDSLLGFGGADMLSGGAGPDNLFGHQGNDSLNGGDDNDNLFGGTGDDLVDGGAGFNLAGYAPNAFDPLVGGVTVDLNLQGVAQNTGQGWDTLVNIQALNGTQFNDTLIGDGNVNLLIAAGAGSGAPGGDDQLFGNGGDDLLIVGSGNVLLDGGTGNDTVNFGAAGAALLNGVTVSLALQGGAQATGSGNMTLIGIENLSGTGLADTLIGDGGDNALSGSGGNDVLIGGAGNDSLRGDAAFTAFSATDASLLAPYLAPDASVFAGQAVGDDTLEGGLGNDLLDGGGGSDTASYVNASGGVTVTLTASGGSSSGADGTDTLISIENVTGGGFRDVVTGNNNANVLAGGDGHDSLSGAGGNDTLQGGNGDDGLTGGAGDDIIDGGAGFDRANYNVGATAGVTVNLTLTGAQNTGQGFDTLTNVEHVVGTTFNDVITGNAADNWLWGGSLGTGVTGNDTISGGDGNDLVEVGTGSHTLSGGNGTGDTLSFFGGGTDITSTGVAFNLATTTAQNTRQGTTNANGFENLSGSVYGDLLTGNSGDNVLAGNSGNDTLTGGLGNDSLYGDGGYTTFTAGGAGTGAIRLVADVAIEFGAASGNDTLNGGDGDDFLYGGGGNDILKGDKDNDTLYGGTGNDTLVGGQGNDRFVIEANSGADTISGFAHVDNIYFDASSGVTSFSQLTLTKIGGTSTLITWGNGNSILIDNMKPSDLTAADFSFASAPALLGQEIPATMRVYPGSVDTSGQDASTNWLAPSPEYLTI
jgi:Ca2+-binding RTX toxin-like protein